MPVTERCPFPMGLSVQDIETKLKKIEEETRRCYDEVAAVPLADVTWDNTMHRLITAPHFKTNPDVSGVKFMANVHPDEAMRTASSAAQLALSKLRVEGFGRQDVFLRLRALHDGGGALSEVRRFQLARAMQAFEDKGLGLPQHKRDAARRLMEQESELNTAYQKNVAADNQEFLVDQAGLAGMSEEFVEGLEKRGDQFVLTLKYPHSGPIAQMCDAEETRRTIHLAQGGMCPENEALLAQAVRVRHELAAELGFGSYSEYVLRGRMAQRPEAVASFLNGLIGKLKGPALQDLHMLRDAKRAHTGDAAAELRGWDLSYYETRLRKERFDLDPAEIKQYFPLRHVIKGTLEIYEQLLGLRFTEVTEPDALEGRWHEDVRLFVVHDAADGGDGDGAAPLVGFFFLDLHPRKGKYNHAAIFHLVKQDESRGQVPVDAMVCNFPKGDQANPSCIPFGQVVTFFHEFGHVMHALCSRGTGNMTKFAKCPRDFVEAPSQMLENWCYDKEVLARISSHVKTGDPLPDRLRARLVEGKDFLVALGTMRQLYFTSLDFRLHDAGGLQHLSDLQRFADDLHVELQQRPNEPGCNALRKFAHIMSQYQSAYYGYLWSQVLAADMFKTRFGGAAGVFDQQAGRDYRDKVLGPGGNRPTLDSVTDFLGRPPKSDAFLRSLGLPPDDASAAAANAS